jgi:hypothetical protein
MENIASQSFAEHAKVGQCVVIMINADEARYPYGTLAVFKRPPDT